MQGEEVQEVVDSSGNRPTSRGRLHGRPRFASLACLLIAGAALVAGCGGDDGGDETSADDDAKAQFIAEADAICQKIGDEASAKVEKLVGSGEPVASGEQFRIIFGDITLPATEDLYERLAALGPPPGDEEQIQAIIDAGEDAVAKAEKRPLLLAKPVGEGNPLDEAIALQQEYGFEVCGAGEDPAQ